MVKYNDDNANVTSNPNTLTIQSDVGGYGGNYRYWNAAQWCAKFNFIGTQLNLYGIGYNNRSTSIDVLIDGIKLATFSQYTTDGTYSELDASVVGLTSGEHCCQIINNQNMLYLLDAIEVDGILKIYNTDIIATKSQASSGGA